MRPDERFNEKAFDYYVSLTKIRTHFANNYSQSFSLSDAAELVGKEPKHFSKFFRRKVGIGFKHWVAIVRIQKAVESIQMGDQTLTEIALTVGFQDLRTFERTFKAHKGSTPRQFRAHIIG